MGSDGLPNLKQNTADLGLWIQNSPNNIDYTLHINGVDLGDSQKNLAMFPKSYGSHPAQQLIDAFNLGYAGARGWPVSQVTLTEAGQYAQALQDLGDQWMTEAIMASPANFDRVYDAGRQRWLDAGAQVIINERAAKYQAAR
jgi:putative aldouronate transport system substrate-binding protein